MINCSNMKKIMILGASILQLPAIKKAKELGFYVYAVDADPNAIGFQYANESVLVSTIDTDRIVLTAVEKQIDGIMTLATDMPMRAVATVAEKLNLMGISIETAINTTDKLKMRQRLALFKIPIPLFFKSYSIDEYYNNIKHFNNGYIVKPADNSGSRGIFLVKSNNDVEIAFNHAKKYSRSGAILVEEYMIGREVSVETLSLDGKVYVLAITDKLTSGAPYFVEMGHSQPAQFDFHTIEKIKKVACDAIIALDIKNGPSHTEIIVTDEGPKIVEIGARLGGGCITTHLVPLSTGVDMVECSIKIALKEKPEFNEKINKASAIRFFKTSAGQINSISGVKEALLVKGIHEITLLKKEGDIINDIRSGSDRIGFVIAQGENVKEAVNSCEIAIDLIKILINRDHN